VLFRSIRVVNAPLDVLAQVILAMTNLEEWNVDDLYGMIRTSYPYRDLPRRHFDLVLEMLAGRYAGTRIRELRTRISLDRLEGRVRAMEGVRGILYMSGGTIPDRGYYDLRTGPSRSRIGELDEEFVYERSVGDTFALANRVWRITSISHSDVEVEPAAERPGIIPFWKGEERSRGAHFSGMIGRFLERAESRLDDEDFTAELSRDWHLDDDAASALMEFLRLQRAATGRPLPHIRHLVVEVVRGTPGRENMLQAVLHTVRGGAVNRPFALALGAALEKKYGPGCETLADNDCVLVMVPGNPDPREILSLVTPENVRSLLRERLEGDVPPPRAAHVVPAQVGQDAEEPRAHLLRVPARVQLLVSPHEGLLHHVRRHVLAAHHAPGVAVEDVGVAAHQEPVGVPVPGEDVADDLGVGALHGGCHGTNIRRSSGHGRGGRAGGGAAVGAALRFRSAARHHVPLSRRSRRRLPQPATGR